MNVTHVCGVFRIRRFEKAYKNCLYLQLRFGELKKGVDCEGVRSNKLKQYLCYWQPVERVTRHFNPLVIPAKLQKDLPFKSKPKLMKKRTKPTLETKRAVVMEPHEKKVSI